MRDKNELDKGIPTKSLILLLIGITIIWLLIGLLPFYLFKSPQTSGYFGDTFGAVNALFSALALGGLIYTIFLQRTELRLQRLELEETRKELARSASAQEESQAALKAQVASMALTAKINALNSLIQAADYKMARGTLTTVEFEHCKKDILRYSDQLEMTLKEIDFK